MTNRIKTVLFSIAFTSIAAAAFSAARVQNDAIWTSIFGGTHSKSACLARAEATVDGYLRLHGGEGYTKVKEDSWGVVGYNFEPGSVDVVFTCADALAKESIGNAYVSLHADGENAQENLSLTYDRLTKIWNLMK